MDKGMGITQKITSAEYMTKFCSNNATFCSIIYKCMHVM